MSNKGVCTTCNYYKYDCGYHFIDNDGHINYNIPRESMYDGILGDIPACWEPSEQYKKLLTNERIHLLSTNYSVDELKQAYWNKDMQNAKDDPCIVDAMTDWAIRTIKDLPSVNPQYTEE